MTLGARRIISHPGADRRALLRRCLPAGMLVLFSAGVATAQPGIVESPIQAETPAPPASGAETSPWPRPQWIWGTADRQPAQTVRLYRTLVLPDGIIRARLRAAADFTRCRLIVNGQVLHDLDAYGPRLDIDVTDQVRSGDNRIELLCTSADGPAAIALSLVAESVAGPAVSLITDQTWQGSYERGISESGPDGRVRRDADAVAEADPVAEFGRVTPEMWADATRTTALDDYTQWKRATGDDRQSDPATFATLPGFEIELLHSATPDEGSWVSMAIDPQGRLTIAREDQGLIRMTLAPEGNRVEVVNDSLLECRGLLYAYDSLYANANNSKGMYRLRDTTGDDRFDEVTLLREFPGGVGHGRNDLALGPDGWIYSIHGDAVELPATDVVDVTSPLREARNGTPSREGYLLRTDQHGQRWELLASGLRNPFGIAFSPDGELFTYDADAEFDMGAPWYRPTRIVHLVPGADYGWRGLTGQWPPYQLDHAANALPVGDIGKGSPTAVKSGQHSHFPPPYRDALFVLDWAYGRVLACHLQPRGAGYRCAAETFLQGRPLNVTDVDFGPRGAMYLITGGRKTRSALYRIRYVGDLPAPPERTSQQEARNEFSRQSRQQRRRLESLLGSDEPTVLSAAWPYLRSADPTLRHAARVAVEHQNVEGWSDKALSEQDPQTASTALLALARSGHVEFHHPILERLNELPLDELAPYDQQELLRAYTLCLADASSADGPVISSVQARLRQWFSGTAAGVSVAPTGAGPPMGRGLSLLLSQIGADALVPLLIDRLKQAASQEERLHYLFALRNQREGWTPPARETYFAALHALEQTALGGEGMPGFLRRIRSEATATLTEAEARQLKELLQPSSNGPDDPPLRVDRPVVRHWSLDDLQDLLSKAPRPPDRARGRELFEEVLCIQCHRSGNRGGVTGPDLTSVARRFSRRDLLTSILAPSEVIADTYRNLEILTRSGQVVTGRVLTGGDYRSPTLRIATDPLKPFEVREIPKSEIEWHRPSPQSPMPRGLLDSLTAAEIRDLLAYLESLAWDPQQ